MLFRSEIDMIIVALLVLVLGYFVYRLLKNPDVNGDGKVDAKDAVAVAKQVAKETVAEVKAVEEKVVEKVKKSRKKKAE